MFAEVSLTDDALVGLSLAMADQRSEVLPRTDQAAAHAG
jgi:hypothetical protein